MTDARPELAGQPPPYGQHPHRSLLERTVLDSQVAEQLRRSGRWPWSVPLGPTGVLVALIVVANLDVHHAAGTATESTGSLAASIVGELLLLGAVVLFARPVARREGGFAPAVGLDRVRGRDWLPWITGVGIVFAARIAVGVVAAALSHGTAAKQSSNVRLHVATPSTVVLLVVLAVVVAPVTEELMFRGVMLRALMQRMRFWPAALISTVVFAGLHAYEVRTLAGALTLVAGVGVLGLGNCYLVRITGRLVPGIMVHATFNALAVLVAVARAR